MKKIFLTLALSITCAIFAQAQTEKGTLLLGGGAEFKSTSADGASVTNYSLSPNIGYFVAENIAVGARVDFGGSSSDGESVSNYQIAPFARYYFLPIGSNAKLFGDASVGFAGSSAEGDKGATVIAVQAGPAFFLNQHTALELAARFASISSDGQSATQFGIRVGLQIHFGK